MLFQVAQKKVQDIQIQWAENDPRSLGTTLVIGLCAKVASLTVQN